MHGAVVIGNHTQGLGVVRSAAEACDAVWAVNDGALALSRFSRSLSGYKRLPWGTLRRLHETESAAILLRALIELPVGQRSVLFGVDEDITEFIHRHRDVLSGRYFIPDVPLQRIYDKHAFNLLLPESARIDTRLCSEVDLDALPDPARFILKGRQGSAFRRLTGKKALYLAGLAADERARLFELIAPERVIVQEVVESDRPVVSVCSLSIEGRIVGLFGYEKVRQHPDRFGTGTYLRSTDVGRLTRLVEHVVERVGFTGISEIEVLLDRRTGAPKVIEMNPRTWKSIHFATRCGQNLVARYLEFASTGTVAHDLSYSIGDHWADLATDIPEMVRQRRIRGYDRGSFECTWDRRDPAPAVALWTLFPLIAVEERLKRRGGRSARAHRTTSPQLLQHSDRSS